MPPPPCLSNNQERVTDKESGIMSHKTKISIIIQPAAENNDPLTTQLYTINTSRIAHKI